MMKKKTDKAISASLRAGAIALVFLILGYQAAIFIHKAAVAKITANRDKPDTVYVVDRETARALLEDMSPGRQEEFLEGIGDEDGNAGKTIAVRRNSGHSSRAQEVRDSHPSKSPEAFRFDPNTVGIEDLQRLGFTLRQAESIDNYRRKGGHFARKSDFAKSYVVSEETYARLEPYITIPRIDINRADSASLVALPGIGGWYAAQIIRHRSELGGFNDTRELMNIYRFDEQKYAGLADLVTIRDEDAVPFPLWTLPADSLSAHPYIRNWKTARGIVLYRENNPREEWTLELMLQAGVLSDEQFTRLSRMKIAAP